MNAIKDIFGIINVNKPKGFTSHDVVAKLRKILGIKQVGHTGTLDPMATGVLPVCVGKATKTIQYLESSKAYRAFIKLGIKTDTYDMEGQILEKNPVNLDIEEIKKHLEVFEGEIIQTPPIYSAIHYKGKRLYEYARKNIEITDIPTRKVTVNSINLVLDCHVGALTPAWLSAINGVPSQSSCLSSLCRKSAPRNDENPVLIVDIDCSEGTYIRSIAHDLGEKLGYGACLSDLIRTKAGKFTLKTTYTLEEIESFCQSEGVDKFLINPIKILPLEIFEIDENLLDKIKNGQYFSVDFLTHPPKSSSFLQLVFKNKLAAIARFEDNIIKPVNVFI